MSVRIQGHVVRESIRRDIITCIICSEVFIDPKKLPCDHVYCKRCLEKLIEGGVITCPECRYLVVIQDSNVNNLDSAFQIIRFQEFYESISAAYHPCEVHETQTLSHYCKTCDKLMCRDCVIRSNAHKEHECDYIEKMAGEIQTSVTEALKRAEITAEKFSMGLTNISETRDDIVLQGQQLQEQIERSFEEFQKILEERKASLLASIKEEVDRKAQLVADQEEELRGHITKITKTIEGVKRTTNQGNEVLLMHKTNNIKRLDQACRTLREHSLDPVQRPHIGLHFQPQLFRKRLEDCSTKYRLADPTKCTVDVVQLQPILEGELLTTTVLLIDTEGKPCLRPQLVDGALQSLYNGSVTNINIVRQTENRVCICFKPLTRGRHTLAIKVNNIHAANSPLNVFVHKRPEKLGQVVAIFTDINPFGGLECSDDCLIVPENDKISMFDRRTKQLIMTIQQPAVSDVVVDPVSKAFFVSDRNKHMIHKFSEDGRHLRGVGGDGKEPGLFNNPGGLAINISQEGEHELYICDVENKRIQIFDMDLNYKQIMNQKTVENITFSNYGNMYSTDHDQIVVTSPSGGQSRRIRKAGKVSNARGIKLFNDYTYITNCDRRGSVSVFKMPQGEFVTSFGEGLLHHPQGLAIDKDGFVYVTSDSKVVYVF